ncbi:hypothetical protein HanPSC8_Chr09g0393021 [Helianthus annuus]|nr:hypothetical protein HanPSC8_Chr09g0393021 [Helianthus annuus]
MGARIAKNIPKSTRPDSDSSKTVRIFRLIAFTAPTNVSGFKKLSNRRRTTSKDALRIDFSGGPFPEYDNGVSFSFISFFKRSTSQRVNLVVR